MATAAAGRRARPWTQSARGLPDRLSSEHHPALWVLRCRIHTLAPYAALRREQLSGEDPEAIVYFDQAVKAAKALCGGPISWRPRSCAAVST
ncbi:hypothetical protein ACIBL5_33860 [Streptomyces sp. NPDC050516]|uniref:hypothetical protein n=1 Tax=Streptomyces sp. NPDC050516 TaxID=3365621 RepID=UPI0037B562F6